MKCKQLWRVPPLRRIVKAVVCLNTTSCVSLRTRMPWPKQGLQLQPGPWSKDMFKQSYGWPNSSHFMCLRNNFHGWKPLRFGSHPSPQQSWSLHTHTSCLKSSLFATPKSSLWAISTSIWTLSHVLKDAKCHFLTWMLSWVMTTSAEFDYSLTNLKFCWLPLN